MVNGATLEDPLVIRPRRSSSAISSKRFGIMWPLAQDIPNRKGLKFVTFSAVQLSRTSALAFIE
jgi:hypothetical protein